MTRAMLLAMLLALLLAMLLPLCAAAEASCDKNGKCCASWVIDQRRDDGTVWGLIEEPTLEKAEKRLAREQEFEHTYCRWIERPFPCDRDTYQHPAAPRCADDAPDAPDGDVCAKDLRDRIAQLEARTNASIPGLMAGDVAHIASGVSGTFKEANPFELAGHTLSSHGIALQHAAGRLKDLRKTLEQRCDGDAIGQIFWAGGAYGHTEAESDAETIRRQIQELERRVKAATPRPLPLPVEELPEGKVATKKSTPNGALIFGKNGRAQSGSVLSGRMPIAFVYREKGALRIGRVEIARKTLPDGSTHITITGRGGGLTEVVEIRALAPDKDADGVPDATDKCPDKPGKGTKDGCPLATPTPLVKYAPTYDCDPIIDRLAFSEPALKDSYRAACASTGRTCRAIQEARDTSLGRYEGGAFPPGCTDTSLIQRKPAADGTAWWFHCCSSY